MQRRSAVAGAALLLVAGLVGAGCGESTKDAEQSLCSDLANLRSSMQQLTSDAGDASSGQIERDRKNVQQAWADVKTSADNLGDDRFDDVQDAWEDIADTLSGIDDKDSLDEGIEDLQEEIPAFDKAKQELASGIDCSDTDS